MNQTLPKDVKTTKNKLIETAIDLIWQSSYGSVSVDDICRAADVKKGSFYHFFPSKVDLALAAIDTCYETARPEIEAAFASEVPPLERFVRYADLMLKKQYEACEKYGHVCGCPFTTLGSEMAGQQEKIRERTEEIFEQKRAYYEQALQDAVEAGLIPATTDIIEKAAEIHSYGIGLATSARIQNSLKNAKNIWLDGIFRIIGVEAPVLTTKNLN